MSIDLNVLGWTSEVVERSWTSTDAILYALGVGAGSADPAKELHLTTENTRGVGQEVLPTFAIVLAQVPELRPRLGDFDPARAVHAQQSLDLHEPLPVEGTVLLQNTVTGIYDKGSGALVTSETRATSPDNGRTLFTTTAGVFVRGEGGFGGGRGPSTPWERPERDPDGALDVGTRPDQALLYRLSGDRNPLHSDPAFAARAGFPRPILHGLATYGVSVRALLAELGDGTIRRVQGTSGRFSKPVLPGDDLRIAYWRTNEGVLFQTSSAEGAIVLDHGVLNLGPKED